MVFRFRVRRNWRVTAREGKGEINVTRTGGGKNRATVVEIRSKTASTCLTFS